MKLDEEQYLCYPDTNFFLKGNSMDLLIPLAIVILTSVVCVLMAPRWFAAHVKEEKAWRMKEAESTALRTSRQNTSRSFS